MLSFVSKPGINSLCWCILKSFNVNSLEPNGGKLPFMILGTKELISPLSFIYFLMETKLANLRILSNSKILKTTHEKVFDQSK